MNRIARAALAAVVSLAVLAPLFAADLTLKLGHLANEDNTWHLGAVKFGEELAARTFGRIAVLAR